MITYVLDTNIISYILKGDNQIIKAQIQAHDNGHECVIPVVAFYEIKRGLLAVGAFAKMIAFEKMCCKFDIGEMNIVVWEKAAQLHALLRQQGTLVEDADLLIAAFCIVNDYTLVTNNTRHFEVIDGLKHVNWKQ